MNRQGRSYDPADFFNFHFIGIYIALRVTACIIKEVNSGESKLAGYAVPESRAARSTPCACKKILRKSICIEITALS